MNKIKIKLIIGLGNPGDEYANTRHNMGFLFVATFSKKLNAPEFIYDKKFKAEISELKIVPLGGIPHSGKNCKLKILAARPMTFMNKSGGAVAALAKFHKIKPENILIVHDDIDIPWGGFKLSCGHSSAGHKGVESVIKALKTKNFWRLRIGIQPTLKKHTSADKIILKKFTQTELKTLGQTFKKAIGIVIAK